MKLYFGLSNLLMEFDFATTIVTFINSKVLLLVTNYTSTYLTIKFISDLNFRLFEAEGEEKATLQNSMV